MTKKKKIIEPIKASSEDVVKAIVDVGKSMEEKKYPRALTSDGVISPIIKAECWILDNGKYIVRGRGFIRTLTGVEDDKKLSGQRFKRLLNSKALCNILSEELRNKLSIPIDFYTKKGKMEWGYDATALPQMAKDFWKAYLTKKIKEGDTYFYEAKNSEKLVNAFLNLSITTHIEQITGFNPKAREFAEAFFRENFVRELPSGQKRKFEYIGFFDGMYKIYGLIRKKDKPWQNPSFFGKFINKYIYTPLDVIVTNGKIKTRDILRKQLKEKRGKSGRTLYSFIQEKGEAKFFGHLGMLTHLMKVSDNKDEFDELFNQFFTNLLPTKDLFEKEHRRDVFSRIINKKGQ